MQALQKAAKEREDAIRPQRAGMLASELALEPIAFESRQDPAGAAGKSSTAACAGTPAQAATVLRVTDTGPGWIDWWRDHRKQMYGLLVGLGAVGYAIYFYLSVYHPAWLRRPLSRPVAAVAPPAAPVANAPSTPKQAGGDAAVAAARLGSATADLLLQSGSPSKTAIARPLEGRRSAPAPTTVGRRSVSDGEPARRQVRDSISVKPGGEAPPLNPQLGNAYEALRSGRTEEARRLYDVVLWSDPRNTDALLGRAMVAQQQGNPELATRYLFQVLEVDPSNTLAQGGLINLLGRADPQSAETKLKSLIAQEPSAFLFFSLGNLYADQGNWPAAQAAYFQAHHLARANPDYAFNLAVSLEHLSQPKLALNFYRRALELAVAAGRASFDPVPVRERMARLAAAVE